MRKLSSEPEAINLTPMIDIVFQMIIFFILTLDMDKAKFSDELERPIAPNGEVIEEWDIPPINVEVAKNGYFKVGGAVLTQKMWSNIARSARNRYGQHVPVIVHGDLETEHRHIRAAMDIASKQGLYKIYLAALQEAK